MNDGLLDGFRHNAWATREVLQACQQLTDAQLDTSVPGTFGSILATLRHTVLSDGGYCQRLTGDEPPWFQQAIEEAPTVAKLAGYANDLATRWEHFLAQPFDAERTFAIDWEDGFVRDVPAGVVLVQALHHANEHRTQICTTLTTIGVESPQLGVWEFAEATDRALRRTG